MKDDIEFYTSPDGSIYMEENGVSKKFDASCTDLTDEIWSIIEDIYPDASKGLLEAYKRSEANRPYQRFLMVARFIKCNFGEYDGLSKDYIRGKGFSFERVRCPLRGECPLEGIVCMPKKDSKLSERETQVATLLASGKSRVEIAEELFISPYTVTRHIANIKARLNISTPQIISMFCNDHQNR